MGAVHLRDIRSDGFALFFASLPGEEAEGGEEICGILSGMILSSFFLMMVALAHNGYTTDPALKQLLLHGLPVFSIDPRGTVCSLLKVRFSWCMCVCVYTSTWAPSRLCIMGVCVFEQCVNCVCLGNRERDRERERELLSVLSGDNHTAYP